LLIVDLVVVAGCLIAIGSLLRWRLTAVHDEYEIQWFLLVSAPILTSVGAVFAIAAIGHWRRYTWSWPVQWIAFGTATLTVGALAYILLDL